MYVINIRREPIGYICPRCHYNFIKFPTKALIDIRDKIELLENKRPTFKQKIYTACDKCGKTEFVECRKNTKKPFKNQAFGDNTWVCWCVNPIHKESAWSQSVPKIRMISYH